MTAKAWYDVMLVEIAPDAAEAHTSARQFCIEGSSKHYIVRQSHIGSSSIATSDGVSHIPSLPGRSPAVGVEWSVGRAAINDWTHADMRHMDSFGLNWRSSLESQLVDCLLGWCVY